MFKNYRLVKRGIMVSFLARAKKNIFPHNVQTSCVTHPASYAMVTSCIFLSDKEARTCS
jgi:hypothetical protein